MNVRLLVFFLCFFASLSPAAAVDPLEDPEELERLPQPKHAYYRYLKARRLKCTGDGAQLDRPFEMTFKGRAYTYTGPELRSTKPDPDGQVVLGVLGAIKDFSAESRKALSHFLEKFTKEKVDALVLLGDVAATEFELTQVLLFCARSGLPVLAIIGNTEGRAAFNRAVLASLKVAPNVINMDIVRRVDLGGAVLVSLPGYRNRKFVHQTGGCSYSPRDVRNLSNLVTEAPAPAVPAPMVFLCHGPPRGKGREALDFAAEGGNVGDALLADWLAEQKIHFGLFSHILEAGGQSTDQHQKRVRPGKWTEHIYLNVGSANPLAWQLNSGKLSCGMAAVFKIKGKQASYELLKYPCKR
jgi:Icc-related predicted phosphoesterase